MHYHPASVSRCDKFAGFCKNQLRICFMTCDRYQKSLHSQVIDGNRYIPRKFRTFMHMTFIYISVIISAQFLVVYADIQRDTSTRYTVYVSGPGLVQSHLRSDMFARSARMNMHQKQRYLICAYIVTSILICICVNICMYVCMYVVFYLLINIFLPSQVFTSSYVPNHAPTTYADAPGVEPMVPGWGDRPLTIPKLCVYVGVS